MSTALTDHAAPTTVHALARFEFRSFGQQFDEVRRRMESLTRPLPGAIRERTSDEVYIVSHTSEVHNVKLRDGKLDIKRWTHSVDDLQQWEPLAKLEFPVRSDALRTMVFPALEVEPPFLPEAAYDEEQFLAVVRAHPALTAVRVHKRRFAYFVHDTQCEYAVVLINGARVVTVSCESSDIAAIHLARAATGMAALENINYPQAIKRVIGMSALPLAN